MVQPNGWGVPALGARIRSERQRRGVTMRGLAGVVGVSASLLSRIETGKTQPSVSTLYAITTALGVSVADLFDAQPVREVASTGEPMGPDTGPQNPDEPAGSIPPRAGGTVVRAADRDRLTLDSGVTWERLGWLPGTPAELLRVTYEPGGTSSSGGDLMRHLGAEYGYLVSGELVLTLGDEDYTLTAGDSVCFDSSIPHRLRNLGESLAVGIWFLREPG